jgi:WD40 repeat protein
VCVCVFQTCCGATRDGQYLLAGSSGSQGQGAELTVWDRRKERKPLREYKGHSESVQSCMFCSYRDNTEEHLIASVASDSVLKIWDRETGECLHSEIESGAGPLTSVVAPDKGLVGYSSFQNGVSIWTINRVEDAGRLSLAIRARY